MPHKRTKSSFGLCILCSYSLVHTRDYEHFTINKTNGVITASSWFEEQSTYNLKVEVKDQPTNGESSLQREVNLNVYLAKELVVPAFDDDVTPTEVR